jgi:hypothetical protein
MTGKEEKRILVYKPERRRPVGKPRDKGKNILVYLKITGSEGVDSSHLAPNRKKCRVKTEMNFRVTQNTNKTDSVR